MRSTKKINKVLLSIVVPVFNEEIRVNNLYKLHEHITKKKYIKECIVVNDGSSDTTLSQLRTIRLKTKIKIVSYKKNRGKGYAIKKGIEKATGTHAVIMDVDLSTDLRVLDELIPLLKTERVVVGTRKNPHATLIQRQPVLREMMGRAFTTLSQWVTGVTVSDFTCGLKCYEMGVAKKIAKLQKIDRWAFDNEYLYLASKMGIHIAEIPVIWKNDRKTKVRFPQDILTSLRDLLRIRLGRYEMRLP
jgi:dolichyl-phosphate beta-glucosyltransferase